MLIFKKMIIICDCISTLCIIEILRVKAISMFFLNAVVDTVHMAEL